MKKRNFNFKRFLRAAGIVALSVALSMGGMTIVNKINDRQLNPDNLLKYEYYGEGNGKGLTTEWEKGSLKATWNDNGSFVLTGQYKDPDKADTDFHEYNFANVTLAAGEYTFSHGNKNAAEDSYHLHITSTGTKPIDQVACDEAVTFKLDETAIVSFSFRVKNNKHILWAKFEPVLVKGKTAGEFYAK